MPFITTKNPAWRELLGVTNYDFYHLPEYAELDAELMDGTALAWLFEGDLRKTGIAGEIGQTEQMGRPDHIGRCLIPLISRSFGDVYDLVSPYGYPGILCERALSDREALEVVRRFNREADQEGFVCSFIRLNPFLNNWNFDTAAFPQRDGNVNIPGDSGVELVRYGHTVCVDLRDCKGEPGFSENHRRNIRKLKREGCYTSLGDWSLLPAFIRAYRQTMVRRNAKKYYLFPDGYFMRLKELLGDHLVLIAALDRDGVFMSGSIFTLYNGIMQFHLGGTTDAAVAKSSSKLVMEAAMAAGRQCGCDVLHLGGGLGGSDDGLYRFKKGFAGSGLNYNCLQLTHNRVKYYHPEQAADAPVVCESSFFPYYRR